jgi:oligopeptide transport system substrate-binding protein
VVVGALVFRPLSLVLVVVAVLASACSSGGRGQYFGKTDPPDGQVLRYISGPEPESLDPQIATGQPEGRIHMALFDGLTEYDPRTAAPIPSLAGRWEIGRNNTEFTFHLRTDARWSNGRPITAHDFVYTLRRGLSPELAARAADLAYDLLYAEAYNDGGVFVRHRAARSAASGAPSSAARGAASSAEGSAGSSTANGAAVAFIADRDNPAIRLTLPGSPKARARAIAADPELAGASDLELVPVTAEDLGVAAIDDHTLVMRMARPTPYLLGLLAHQFFRAVPREAIEQYGDAWTRPDHIVTSGAFLLDTWRPYDRIIVRKNPHYWARVDLDRITFYASEDLTTMMNLYKAGEVDATFNHTVPAGWVDDLRRYPDYMDGPEATTVYYLVNTTRPPMNDVRVRKAFNAAIDKQALAGLRRTAKPLTGVNPDGIFPGYPQLAGDTFNPERARALLAEAGFKNPSGEYDPSTFPEGDVALMYNTASSNRQTAEFAQAQWKRHLGVTVALKNLEFKTQLVARTRLDYGGFARGGWAGDFLDPFTFLTVFATMGGDNGTGWSARGFVDLLNDANATEDPAARLAKLARAEALVLDAQPIIPLYVGSTNWLKKPYVKGLYANPLTMHAWRFVRVEHDRAKWEAP